jgi:hypothetical protein
MTEPTTTDFRALCAELAKQLEGWQCYASPDGPNADVLARARAALAQPEPQGPTDEEILALSQEHGVSYTMPDGGVIYGRREGYDMRDDVLSFARAVLARWGRPAIEPEPQGPSDEELVELFNENDWNYVSPETFLDIARSVLELR